MEEPNWVDLTDFADRKEKFPFPDGINTDAGDDEPASETPEMNQAA